MRENNFGRVVFTTSAAGLYGNFGQANYSAAKLGIVGLTKTLSHEGAKYNIKCNVIAPIAKSRMTETIMPPDVLAKLLAGVRLAAGRVPIFRGPGRNRADLRGRRRLLLTRRGDGGEGTYVDPSKGVTAEQIAERWKQINDLRKARAFNNAMEAAGQAMKAVMGG